MTGRPRAPGSVPALLALVLLVSGLASCRRAGDQVDPRTGILRAHGDVDLAGRPHGEWTWWYADGELRERGNFEHGQRSGLWEQWYPEGQRYSAGQRLHDPQTRAAAREGEWRLWYSTGQLRGIGHYEAGLANGPWRWWSHEGRLDENKSGLYRAGELVE